MATSKVTYLGELRTSAVHLASGNTIITDAPTDNQGKGEFFSPTDLLATSLASCIMTIMGILAERYNIDINGTTAEVTKIMGIDPRRVVEVQIIYTFPKNYSDKEKNILKAAIDNCPVGKSLPIELKQSITLIYPDNE